MASQRTFWQKATGRSAAVLTGAALTAGLLVFPTWADLGGQEAAAEDIEFPEAQEQDPRAQGRTAGEHDHSDDEEFTESEVTPRITVAEEDAERAQHLGKQHFRAEIHSHTAISDGAQLPTDAMEHVAENGNVDFFGVTDHDVVFDLRNADAFNEDRYNSHSDEWSYSHEAADTFNDSSDHLQALIGEEVTWYNSSGHMNIFNADWFVTAKSEGGGDWGTGHLMWDVPTVMARVAMDPDAIAQFNHPATNHGHFGFGHLTPEVDEQIPLFEYQSPDYHDHFVKALDAGWHLAPVWSGDEHNATWVTGNPAHTGVWAAEHSLDSLYQAMRERSMYTTFDVDASLQMGVNGEQMGSILPGDTSELEIGIELDDASDDESFESAVLYTNGGEVAHEFAPDSGNQISLNTTLEVEDGDYYWLKATQADGDEIISSPAWIGETTRGADYAPELDVAETAETAAYGERISLPDAQATDDSGVDPTIETTIYDAAGEVAASEGGFEISSYSDHFIVTHATDDEGNTAADIQRIQVSQDQLDPEGVFQYFGSTATVGETGDQTGLSVNTDVEVTETWAQALPTDSSDWSEAVTVKSEAEQVFEVDTIGTEAEEYQDSITGQPLRSHEFTFESLEENQRYQYRFGVGQDGDWTEPQGEFTSGGDDNAPLYVMGDLQVNSGDQSEHELFNAALTEVRDQKPGGHTVLQVGDFVDNAGRGQYWEQLYDWVLDDLDLRLATMVGNHEVYGDKEFNEISPERNAIFRGMFNHPKNGSEIGESNYSFDHGDIHVSVLNSNYDLQTQLDWLVEDMRATDKQHKVVTGHFSYYGGGHADDAGMATDRALVTEALDQLGVDLYIGGHDHVYKRSTIIDADSLAETAEEEAAGTTYVTMGSSGPKFYENQEFWWDDIVYDENNPMGAALEVTDDGLAMTTYTTDGGVVDEFVVDQPEGAWDVSSAKIADQQLDGVGLLSYPGARDEVTVAVAAYDYGEEELVDLRVEDVQLNHRGTEQFVEFEKPLDLPTSVTAKLFVWDELGAGVPLREPIELRPGMLGEGTAEDPFELRTWQDIENIRWNPDGHYKLMDDLELDGSARAQIGSGTTPFTGVFDGQGHSISGYQPVDNGGAGLFAVNHGTIRNLAVEDADVDTSAGTVGLLVDFNSGAIENSWTSGAIAGASRVGGVVGDSTGSITDTYSTADVRSRSTEAGGVVGVAIEGSTTQRVYSTGNVTSDTRNVGGIIGYGYEGTGLHNAISLNESVTAPSYAHAMLGRVRSGDNPDLGGLLASDASYVSVGSLTDEPAEDNWKGRVVAADSTQSQELYVEDLGWDFDSTWQWDEGAQRPVLQVNPEKYQAQQPAGEPNAEGYYEIATAEELEQITKYPDEQYVLTADLDLSEVEHWEPLGGLRPFTGELDGNGHTLAGLSSEAGGLFNINNGAIYDLAVVDAEVDLNGGRVGIIANVNNGEIHTVYTTGTVDGTSRVGGVVGDSSGSLVNAYSTADVHSRSTEAGGVVGVALAGSITENVYATGAVAAETRNVGGVVGYGYNDTEIANGLAMNPSVHAESYTHRVLGRVFSGETATLDNNWAAESVDTNAVNTADEGETTWMGATVTTAQIQDTAFFTDTLGWDLASVWQWDEDAARPVLQVVPENSTGEPVSPIDEDDESNAEEPSEDDEQTEDDESDGEEQPEEEQPEEEALERDEDGYLLISESGHLAEITAQPSEDFRLTESLDLTGVDQEQLAPEGFTGTFDGAGHTITGYTSDVGGLFAENSGTLRNLGLADATVTNQAENTGLFVDTNRGTVEEVWTSGEITGQATVGGVVGYSYGTVTDTYSTANVTADGGRQAGGVIGITAVGSTTDRVYAAGSVTTVGNEPNAGGITGYAYTGTTVQNSVALNPTVTAGSQASRVVGRVLNGDTATMVNNYALETLVVDLESVTEEGPDTQRGATLTTDEATDLQTWIDTLGWDFENTWQWNNVTQRPMLVNAPEEN